jgi:hypothetical protein
VVSLLSIFDVLSFEMSGVMFDFCVTADGKTAACLDINLLDVSWSSE